MDPRSLDPEELRRYARQLALPEVGLAGQQRLRSARVLLIGAGGLGSPVALYLAAAGVGTLGLVEFDRVDPSNLHRQVLYAQSDVGRRKLEAAAERLRGLNPGLRLETHDVRLDAESAQRLVGEYEITVDGSDNFPTRYAVNDACVMAGRPCVHGAVLRFAGQVSVFAPGRGPCYRCLFPEPPAAGLVPSCEEGGVLGAIPGVIGALQATEALKLLLGIGEPLIGRLLLYDGLAGRFRELRAARDPACPACGEGAHPETLAAAAATCAPQPVPDPEVVDVTPAEVARWRASGRPPLLLDVRTPAEHALAHIEGATLVPLPELPARWRELDAQARIVVYCHFGPRSRAAVEFLRRQGLRQVWNLAGGIDLWSETVDAAVPRY